VQSAEQLDDILTLQLAVAWAGESGEQPRLRWWETDMVSKYGGRALFDLLAPRTAAWATLEAAREAARRVDEHARSKAADPDRLVSLFRFGFAIDEQLQDRIAEHKRSGIGPELALPRLAELLHSWDREAFAAWLRGATEKPNFINDPGGRRLTAAPSSDPSDAARRLAQALVPLADAYPFPHYRVAARAE
jgi:hypothetical protein